MTLLDRLKNIRKINFDDLYYSFLGLEKKQQTYVVIGLIGVFLILLWLPTRFFSNMLLEKEQSYLKYKKDAERLNQMMTEYTTLQKALNETASGTGDNLSELIYGRAESMGIPKKKISLKTLKLPAGELITQEGKDVEVNKVPFDQFMKFIHDIQMTKRFPIAINKLVIKIDRLNRQVVNQASFSVVTIKARKT